MKAILFLSGLSLAAAVALSAGACSENGDPVAIDPTQLLSVTPQGGATGVDPSAPVVVEFDHSLMAGMEAFVSLHQGTVSGPVVPGTWTMSADRMRMTFTPAAALQAGTDHTIHLGGGMMDGAGNPVGFEGHGSHMGGSWAGAGMMGGGMAGHMGHGWVHPTNGSYGMVFTFTTGS